MQNNTVHFYGWLYKEWKFKNVHGDSNQHQFHNTGFTSGKEETQQD